MRYFVLAFCVVICTNQAAYAQINGAGPAELPPEGFEGREYTDSQGCVFLRSTFGGEVTWIPRYGPDRRPVCGESPTAATTATQTPDAPQDAQTATTLPDPAPVASAPVASVPVASSRPAPAPARAQPRRAAPKRAPATRTRLPRADASGRHPSCPASAPYGQLVDTALGRPLVRCVTSPALFLDEYYNGGPRPQGEPIAVPGAKATRTAHVAPKAAGRTGRIVQVGSFGVPSNATRLRARLANAGLPARIHQARGLNVVTVGPFASPGSAHNALASVRRMGFGDAFLR